MTASSPPSLGVSLADALDVGMPPTWPEAVAIVRQLALSLDRETPPILVPDLGELYVLPIGELASNGGHIDPDGPVAGVGRLLGELLDGSQPPPGLRDVHQQAVATPPAYASLASLADALGFFARPNPEIELAAFYARVVPAVEARPRDEALAALREKARTAEQPDGSPQPPDLRRRRKQLIAAGVVLTTVALLWLLRPTIDRWLTGPGAGAVQSVRETIGNVATAAREATSAIIGTSPPAPTEPAPSPTPPPKAPATARRRGTPSTAGPTDGGVASAAPAQSPASSDAEQPADTMPSEPPAPLPDAGIYSAANAEVAPPALVYPQLPSVRASGHPADRPGDLEVLVLEDGTVGEARLIPASNRLQDRMLISAAKAWRFTPASRSGQPVRYRLRIPITW